MLLSEFLSKNNKIIINTDIDGILSGLILARHFNCKIVGFSNSDNKVWFDKTLIDSPYKGVYIDMYVPNKDVMCLDQHIIAVNNRHNFFFSFNNNKLNPNTERARTFVSSYTSKYPFGTVHYIIALMEAEGIKPILPSMAKPISVILNNAFRGSYSEVINFGDFLLRADDAMKTSLVSYKPNARNWWDWMIERSNKSTETNNIVNYLYSVPSEFADKKKADIKSLFCGTYLCSSPDGGYQDILDVNGNYKDEFVKYVDFLQGIIDYNIIDFLPTNKLHIAKGNPIRIGLRGERIDELIDKNKIDGEEVFSYSFIYSPSRVPNFSYTINLKY